MCSFRKPPAPPPPPPQTRSEIPSSSFFHSYDRTGYKAMSISITSRRYAEDIGVDALENALSLLGVCSWMQGTPEAADEEAARLSRISGLGSGLSF